MLSVDNQRRAKRADNAIENYGSDVCESNLIDFLTDSMHWCDAYGADFHICLAQACRHYIHELNDEQHDESRLLTDSVAP